ncbi:hypothetical protein O3G_MSEX008713 [Manduca sexta]|uniref:Nimrod A n=1 Tax=Manduca sexta TaxID=7130 RepID=A0A922CQU7_MANSE|nr:hypothetical protein O3G_MSEX008713 [Manduca sexta]KAG6454459.1 hypothetical protein O3G_MSEX008713 [Manduca sexta]
MVLVNLKSVWTKWWFAVVVVMAAMVMQVTTLNGPNVCMVKQKYNITKRVKYRAPMSVRTYEWCFSMPPRCSKWNTEMRDLTRLETEERTAEVAVCCPGYKMRDVSCVPICPNGKTGPRCSEDCPQNRWGPNCVNECPRCQHGECSPVTGECHCQRGWQGESCELRVTTTTTTTAATPEAPLITYTSTKTSSIPTPSTTTVSATTETKTTAKATAILPAFTSTTATTSVAITTIAPTIASTKITSPMTSEKTTEVVQTTTESHKTIFQTTTESHKQPVLVSITKAIEPVVTESLQTTPVYNKTEIILQQQPTAPSIEVKMIPTVASKNIIKDKKETYASTNFNINGTNEETATTPTITREKMTTPHVTTPFTIIPLTGPKPTEKHAVTTVSTTSTTIKLSPTTELTAVNSVTTKPTTVTTSKETTVIALTVKETKTETTKKPDTTLKVSTTTKFKPKEIWIKPAQKGEPIEAKKITYDVLKHRVVTNKDFTTNTTPKTIIVSIIPTSVSYATFKRIALTTASFIAQKTNTTMKSYNKSTEGFTKPMSTYIYTTPATVKTMATTTIRNTKLDEILVKDIPSQEATLKDSSSKEINKTNSMIEKDYVKKSNSSAVSSFNTIQTTDKKTLLTNAIVSTTPVTIKSNPVHKHITDRKNITKIATKQTTKVVVEKKSNHTKMLTNYKVTTEDPTDEETFHILTEPEHITAVMGEKEAGRTSIDLISVISIAGGVMMAVITVAVVIVMIERCRRPRYEDVRKINDIRMQVMIDGSDAPPPYVRSIFHTPLPEPPMSEKCHYQPISTLDRNLKQFMRPVVVQTISPIMLENFRGILECHYDHLPRRSHDFVPMEARCSIAPSMSDCGELHHIQRTIRDSTLESLKCEAKLDVIDTTTSEPLYAEIPCWRPPSEHAIEILTLNGEAVTEL